MEKFVKITCLAAHLPMINIDTDMIIPKQFLKTIKRYGLGKNLFHEIRYVLNGNLRNDFVLNWDPYKNACILITGENFGCGSSREHAPWSLLDFGFKCIIAPSFADIFFNNCFKNGILPIVLKSDSIDKLTSDAEKKIEIEIDLKNQKILRSNNNDIKFDIDQFRKKCLIEGLDDIGLTLEKIKNIDIYEDKHHHNFPWLT